MQRPGKHHSIVRTDRGQNCPVVIPERGGGGEASAGGGGEGARGGGGEGSAGGGGEGARGGGGGGEGDEPF